MLFIAPNNLTLNSNTVKHTQENKQLVKYEQTFQCTLKKISMGNEIINRIQER